LQPWSQFAPDGRSLFKVAQDCSLSIRVRAGVAGQADAMMERNGSGKMSYMPMI